MIVPDFPFKNETYRIIGLCMEVHRQLGHGFPEIVYKDAIETEAIRESIQYEREKKCGINYKGILLRHSFYADFILFDNIILEVRVTGKEFPDEYISQTLNYMKVAGCRIGLVINFGKRSLEYKRLIF